MPYLEGTYLKVLRERGSFVLWREMCWIFWQQYIQFYILNNAGLTFVTNLLPHSIIACCNFVNINALSISLLVWDSSWEAVMESEHNCQLDILEAQV